MKKTLIALALTTTLAISGCSTDSQIASKNLSKAADMFEIERRIVFINGITDGYLLVIEGRCSLKDQGGQLEVTCKTGPSAFKKHFLGLSDNVTYVAEQVDSADVSVYHYRAIFRPQVLIRDVEFKGDVKAFDKHNS